MMVLDYAESGSLRNYLDTSHNELSWNNKIRYLWDIATGLEHIHKNENWKRYNQNEFVALKSLNNSKNVTLEFMNEVFLIYYLTNFENFVFLLMFYFLDYISSEIK